MSQKELQIENPNFICVFNGRKLVDTDVINEIGIIEGSVISLFFVVLREFACLFQDEGNSELDIDALVKSQCVFDEIDNRIISFLCVRYLELSSIYDLIKERKISNAFQEIRSVLFQLDNIPEAIEKLRLHFSSMDR